MKILRQYHEGDYLIKEFTIDGLTVHSTTKTLITQNEILTPTIEEQILFENKYQTMLLEMSTL